MQLKQLAKQADFDELTQKLADKGVTLDDVPGEFESTAVVSDSPQVAVKSDKAEPADVVAPLKVVVAPTVVTPKVIVTPVLNTSKAAGM